MTVQEQQVEEVKILLNLGGAFAGLPRTSRRAKSFFDEIIARFRRSRNPEVRRLVALAFYRASDLFTLPNFARTKKEWRDARRYAKRRFAYFDALLAWAGASSAPELRAWVARVLVMKGAALQVLHRHADSVRAFGKALAFVTAEDELATRVNAARAGWMQGQVLIDMKKLPKALTVLEKAVTRFGAEPVTEEMQSQVVPTIYRKGRVLFLLGRYEEAVDAFAAAIAAARAGRKQALQGVLDASLGKADALVAAKRHREAIVVCNDAVALSRRLNQLGQRAQACELKAAALRGLGQLAAARRADAMAKRWAHPTAERIAAMEAKDRRSRSTRAARR